EILFRCKRAFLLRLKKNVLPEVGHLPSAIALVELDHILQTLNRRIAAASQIGRQVGLEFVVKDGELAFVELANRGNVGGIDDLRPSALHLADERVHKLVDGVVEAEIFAHYSQARAFESGRIEKLRVVGEFLALAVSSRGILGIRTCHGAEKNGD